MVKRKKFSGKKVKKKRVLKKKPIKKVRRASPKKIRSVARRKEMPHRARPVRASARKIRLAFRNLFLFVIISIVSFVLYGAGIITNELLNNFFYLLGMITGFIAVAFLIVLLVFALLRVMGK